MRLAERRGREGFHDGDRRFGNARRTDDVAPALAVRFDQIEERDVGEAGERRARDTFEHRLHVARGVGRRAAFRQDLQRIHGAVLRVDVVAGTEPACDLAALVALRFGAHFDPAKCTVTVREPELTAIRLARLAGLAPRRQQSRDVVCMDERHPVAAEQRRRRHAEEFGPTLVDELDASARIRHEQ